MDFCFFAFKVLFLVSFLSPQNPIARSCSKEFYNPITCSVRNHPSVKWRPSFLVQEQPSNHLLFTPLCSPYDSSVLLLRYTSLYIYFSLHLSSCGSLFFFPPILPNILTLFLNLFRQKSLNSMQCSRCSWTMGLQSILITHSFLPSIPFLIILNLKPLFQNEAKW